MGAAMSGGRLPIRSWKDLRGALGSSETSTQAFSEAEAQIRALATDLGLEVEFPQSGEALTMWFLAGAAAGAAAMYFLLRWCFDGGWLSSEWYDGRIAALRGRMADAADRPIDDYREFPRC